MDNVLIGRDSVEQTKLAVSERGIQVELVDTGAEAFQRLQTLIPSGAEVMFGGSITLRQIGFEEALISGNHAWKNLKSAVLAEKDPAKQFLLRQQATLAEYHLGSPQAISQTGELVFASESGSQLPSYVYSSKHVIWVAGVQKIVPTLDAAIRRVREYCLPAADQRFKDMGLPGSMIGKLLIFERENPRMKRDIRLILVNEPLGV